MIIEGIQEKQNYVIVLYIIIKKEKFNNLIIMFQIVFKIMIIEINKSRMINKQNNFFSYLSS